MPRKLLCQRHPFFYFLSVWQKRIQRYWKWSFSSERYAKAFLKEKLPFRVKKHQSVLLKRLGLNEGQMQWQYNKTQNLALAIRPIDHLLIAPGETFSFCRRVGLPTKRKGYLLGMELSRGEARAGIGGGICQISNLIHWLVLHSPLRVIERYHHSFDPFPDEGRVLPFGSGATVFYNYRDYQFRNETPYTFQLILWLTPKLLEGELRVSQELPYSYHVYEKEHAFLKIKNRYYRKNEIWRQRIDKSTGRILEEEQLTRNFAEVRYVPAELA